MLMGDQQVVAAPIVVVPESAADPVEYYRPNFTKSLEFVAHLLRNGCGRLIFSSPATIRRAGVGPKVSMRIPSLGQQLDQSHHGAPTDVGPSSLGTDANARYARLSSSAPSCWMREERCATAL
jgi:nucleoside-diphosphate-sugar epimerase